MASSANVTNSSLKQKEQVACLFHFFKHMASETKNLNMLAKLCVPLLKIAVAKPYSTKTIRKMANFFYVITSGFAHVDFRGDQERSSQAQASVEAQLPVKTNNARLFLLSSLLDEVFATQFKDFNQVQKWIEVVVEFNVHQWDVCDYEKSAESELFMESMNYLSKIFTQLQQLIVSLPYD